MQNQSSRTNCLLISLLAAFTGAISHAQPVLVTSLQKFPLAGAIGTSISLSKADGAFYGTTYPNSNNTNGNIFTINADGSGYAELHTFAATEYLTGSFNLDTGLANPFVTPGTDGFLYGTTPKGGANNFGTVFKLNANGSGYSVLHSFTSADGTGASVIQSGDGTLYGTTGSSIFKLNADGNGYTVLHTFDFDTEGGDPLGQLLQGSDGALYGANFIGGTNETAGTIFKVNTNGTGFAVLHTFGASGDGSAPIGGLVQGNNGLLYGTTSVGGTNNGQGTIFVINTNGSGYAMLHSFSGTPNDGSVPLGTLVEGSGGFLYGTTHEGGSDGGTIFKIGLDGGSYATLYTFPAKVAGDHPVTGLVRGQTQSNVGALYGTTGGAPCSVFAMIVNPPASITPVTSQTASNQTVVFWPQWAATYTLQSTTNVASGNWVDVSNGTPVFGVQVTSTNPAMFYRLVSP